MNYCPLVYRVRAQFPPDKLPASEREALFKVCDAHLREAVGILEPEWLVGVGDFAMKRAEEIFREGTIKIGRILHRARRARQPTGVGPRRPRGNCAKWALGRSEVLADGAWLTRTLASLKISAIDVRRPGLTIGGWCGRVFKEDFVENIPFGSGRRLIVATTAVGAE